MREVASMSMGPDDGWQDRDDTVTEDVGLPEHERDETRRQAGESLEDDLPVPEHEDDTARGGDTAGGGQNP